MAVGSKAWGWSGSGYNELLRAEITHDSIDIVNNRSKFNYRVWNDSNNSYGDIGRVSASIKTGSTTRASVSNKAISATTGFNQIREIMNGSFYISHNSDGSLANQTFVVSATRTSGNVTSASFNLSITNIPTIPRTSTCDFNVVDMGKTFTVNVDRKSTAFTHRITVYVNNVQILQRTNVGTSVSITPTNNQKIAMHNATPNSQKAVMKVLCETYNGATLIGQSDKTKEVSVDIVFCLPDNPNTSWEEVNTKIPPLTPKIIFGYSNIKVTISGHATAKYGATIKNYIIQVGNQTKTINYKSTPIVETFNNVVGAIFEITAVDSRGLKAINEHNQSNYVISNYTPPVFNKVEADRVDGVGTQVKLNTVINISPQEWLNGNNTLTEFKYRTRPKGGTWSEWFDKLGEVIPIMVQNGNKITINDLEIPRLGTSGEYTLGQEYDLNIRISDGNYAYSGYINYPFQTINFNATILDGKVLESYYKKDGEYHRGYGGMPNENYNHMFYGSMALNGKQVIFDPVVKTTRLYHGIATPENKTSMASVVGTHVNLSEDISNYDMITIIIGTRTWNWGRTFTTIPIDNISIGTGSGTWIVIPYACYNEATIQNIQVAFETSKRLKVMYNTRTFEQSDSAGYITEVIGVKIGNR